MSNICHLYDYHILSNAQSDEEEHKYELLVSNVRGFYEVISANQTINNGWMISESRWPQ